MGMNVGGNGHKAEINVTPMIDVLLVLIIIFMVITPTASRGLEARVPQPAANDASHSSAVSQEIVVTVDRDSHIAINQQPVEGAALGEKLAHLRGINDHIFIRGDRSLDYEAVARVIDVARGAGWDRIGLMTTP